MFCSSSLIWIWNMEYYTFDKGKFAGIDNVLVSATGFSHRSKADLKSILKIKMLSISGTKFFEAGKAYGIKPIGLGSKRYFETGNGILFVWKWYWWYPSPIEAGLGWITKFTKEFTNSAALKAQKENGVNRKLIGFEMIDRGIPRHDYDVKMLPEMWSEKVTSGTQSPSLQKQ